MLDAHQAFFFFRKFLSLLLTFIFSYSDCENLRFPKVFIFFTPSLFRYNLDLLSDEKQSFNLEKISLENTGKFFHRLNVFLEILAFNKVIGIFFFTCTSNHIRPNL